MNERLVLFTFRPHRHPSSPFTTIHPLGPLPMPAVVLIYLSFPVHSLAPHFSHALQVG